MKKVAPHIDFADSSYKFCETKDGNLVVYLNSWDDRTIKITFYHAIQFIYKIGDFIDNVYVNGSVNQFLSDALDMYYMEIPINQPFKSFLIMDISDHVIFEVIAENVLVTKE